MGGLIKFLEAARAIWAGFFIVVVCAIGWSAYQYRTQRHSDVTDPILSVVAKVTDGTQSLFGGVLPRLDSRRWERSREAVQAEAATAAQYTQADRGSDTTSGRPSSPASAVGKGVSSGQSANPVAAGGSVGGTRPLADSRPAPVAVESGIGSSPGGETRNVERPDMRIGVSFRRFASGFCRASQSVADYYTTQVAGRLHVGSGVQFPSIERLTNARERTLAEKELEVRLRCDYELTYGSGAHVAPQRPSFDEWRMVTLQRQYGNGWRQIDLSRLPAQDSASSRTDWNVVSVPLQE